LDEFEERFGNAGENLEEREALMLELE